MRRQFSSSSDNPGIAVADELALTSGIAPDGPIGLCHATIRRWGSSALSVS